MYWIYNYTKEGAAVKVDTINGGLHLGNALGGGIRVVDSGIALGAKRPRVGVSLSLFDLHIIAGTDIACQGDNFFLESLYSPSLRSARSPYPTPTPKQLYNSIHNALCIVYRGGNKDCNKGGTP